MQKIFGNNQKYNSHINYKDVKRNAVFNKTATVFMFHLKIFMLINLFLIH